MPGPVIVPSNDLVVDFNANASNAPRTGEGANQGGLVRQQWVDKKAGSLWDQLFLIMFRRTTKGGTRRLKLREMTDVSGRKMSNVDIILQEEESEQEMVTSAKIQAGIHFSKDRFHCCITIDPRTDRMKIWDGVIILLLIFTTYVTPYEVAFLSTRFNTLFVINRFVDLIFLLDLIRCFFTAYFDEMKQYWVGDAGAIAANYMKGWFTIDLVSILPFDSVGLIMNSDAISKFKAARIIRLMRLLKLLRLLRSARIINRWRDEYGITNAFSTLIRFCVVVVTTTHWMACALRLLPDLFDGVYQTPGCIASEGNSTVASESCDISWLHSQTLAGQPLIDAGPSRQYNVALYWATMTLTTIGYGDVTARTDAESVFMTICMIVSSALYAYTIGEVCGIVATMDEATRAYNKQADMINYFCNDHEIPKELGIRLREYFRNSRSMHRSNYYQLLMPSMSPQLRGEVSAHINSNVEKNVQLAFFRAECKEERKRFLTALTMAMERAAFGPQEVVIARGQRMKGIFLVRNGIAFGGESNAFGQVYTTGKWFGEEGLVLTRRYHYEVRSLNFLIVDIVTKSNMDKILWSGEYPDTYRKMRLSVMKTIFKQCFQRAARVYEYVMQQQGDSFSICRTSLSKDQIDYIRDGNSASDFDSVLVNCDAGDVHMLLRNVQKEMHDQHETTQRQITELSKQLQQVVNALVPGAAVAAAEAAEKKSAHSKEEARQVESATGHHELWRSQRTRLGRHFKDVKPTKLQA
jgi:potassium voltage-gated channel Eag-related subfamily H protein 7